MYKFCCLLIILAQLFAGADTIADRHTEQNSLTLEDIPSYFSEEMAEAFVEKYDATFWVPNLKSGIADSKYTIKERGTFALYLGKYRAPDGCESIMSLIEYIRCNPTQLDSADPLRAVMAGLGYCGSENALQALASMSQELYWKQKCADSNDANDRTFLGDHLGQDTVNDLRAFSINAIAFSGLPEAKALLEKLNMENEQLPESQKIHPLEFSASITHLEQRLDGSHLIEREKYQPAFAAPVEKPKPRSGQPKKAE